MCCVLMNAEAWVRGTDDGQYPSTHLDFDFYHQFDAPGVSTGIFKLLRKSTVSLAQCQG